jgi:broad-specificity NMP kinase
MSFIYITGLPGAGKSAVCKELTRRGYEAHEGDERHLSAFYHNETGEKIVRHVTATERTPEWRALHEWKMSVDALRKLKAKAANKPVFLCGVTSNEDEYIGMFDKVFALVLDEHTLRQRIKAREEDSYGKNEHELAEVLNWQKSAGTEYRDAGAHIIDAAKPLDQVVDEILAYAKKAE